MDPENYEASYLPDAVLIFHETGRIDRATAVGAIRGEIQQGRHWAEVGFEDVSTLPLADGAALLTYKAGARWNDETSPTSYFCSTIYVEKGGQWRVALHQQTLA